MTDTELSVIAALATAPLAIAAPAYADPPRGHCGYWSEGRNPEENDSWYVNCHNANVELRIRIPEGDLYRCVGVGTTYLNSLVVSGRITSAVAVGVC